ncbi:hypothetical protein C8Q76DRAFT_710691 [Earliella scabrosa]|nr:hypothetical protein C8Q76DRAFT_710691 [Earliella scabrosa]
MSPRAHTPPQHSPVQDQHQLRYQRGSLHSLSLRRKRSTAAERIVNRSDSLTARHSGATFAFENIGDALRHKQRMQVRASLRSPLITSEMPDLVASSSSSRASSPAPATPSPVDLTSVVVFPTMDTPHHLPEARLYPPGRTRRSPRQTTGAGRRNSGALLSDNSKRESRSSCLRTSMMSSRQTRGFGFDTRVSNHSHSSDPAITSSKSTQTVVSFAQRLAPLSRFNPYRRMRAESMSSVIDDSKHHTYEGSVTLNKRRRCKSGGAVCGGW